MSVHALFTLRSHAPTTGCGRAQQNHKILILGTTLVYRAQLSEFFVKIFEKPIYLLKFNSLGARNAIRELHIGLLLGKQKGQAVKLAPDERWVLSLILYENILCELHNFIYDKLLGVDAVVFDKRS